MVGRLGSDVHHGLSGEVTVQRDQRWYHQPTAALPSDSTVVALQIDNCVQGVDPIEIGTSARGAVGLDLSVDSQESDTCAVSEGGIQPLTHAVGAAGSG